MFPPEQVYAGVSTLTTARRALFRYPQAILHGYEEPAIRWCSTRLRRRLGRCVPREDS